MQPAGPVHRPRQLERAQWTERKKASSSRTLNDVFSDTGVVVVAHYSGLTVADMTDSARADAEAGASVKVAKNRLARSRSKARTPNSIADLFEGPTLIAYSDDPVAAPKVAVEFAKDERQARHSRWRDGYDRL